MIQEGRRVRANQHVTCQDFPCLDVRHDRYRIPAVEFSPSDVRMIVISEAAAVDPADDYYAQGEPLFARTTLQAFRDAGVNVTSITELLEGGVYLTTAVKCAKTGYRLRAETIKHCALLLGQELSLFPKARVLMLMGDVAIKAVNAVAQQAGDKRVIPAGSTYKIRRARYRWRGMRVFPSYLQAGTSFFIEKSKRRMISEDIAAAWPLLGP